ncbi:hepatitis A virus cellular receptor 1-like [Pygocentrus nattereri]|uniref:hepatitis A virus cellular receptor 1-like n=1 Tax=Pygocentrus nattereri TaxID=42514 RepID=UPI00189191A2|nr:hepatitis A virus cellular receptor 1-like [Pygocentrus nattereri]
MNLLLLLSLLIYSSMHTAGTETLHVRQTVGSRATLYCGNLTNGKVTWSRDTNGQRVDILTTHNGQTTKHIADPDRRYGSGADLVLIILRVSQLDAGRYDCSGATVELSVTSGTGPNSITTPKTTTTSTPATPATTTTTSTPATPATTTTTPILFSCHPGFPGSRWVSRWSMFKYIFCYLDILGPNSITTPKTTTTSTPATPATTTTTSTPATPATTTTTPTAKRRGKKAKSTTTTTSTAKRTTTNTTEASTTTEGSSERPSQDLWKVLTTVTVSCLVAVVLVLLSWICFYKRKGYAVKHNQEHVYDSIDDTMPTAQPVSDQQRTEEPIYYLPTDPGAQTTDNQQSVYEAIDPPEDHSTPQERVDQLCTLIKKPTM